MKNFCKPCILAGFSATSKPVTFDLQKVQSAAFEAVMCTYSEYLTQYRYSASHKWYISEILSKGADSLQVKTRFRPVVTARYLMYNYLIAIGYSAPDIAQIYNVDRTTVLHGNALVSEMLLSKFDNDIKDAYVEFCRLVD